MEELVKIANELDELSSKIHDILKKKMKNWDEKAEMRYLSMSKGYLTFILIHDYSHMLSLH